MTRNDVIRLAREAGLAIAYAERDEDGWQELERFAALVAAEEREECAFLAALCDDEGLAQEIRARGEEDKFEIKEDRIHRDAGGTRAATSIRARGNT